MARAQLAGVEAGRYWGTLEKAFGVFTIKSKICSKNKEQTENNHALWKYMKRNDKLHLGPNLVCAVVGGVGEMWREREFGGFQHVNRLAKPSPQSLPERRRHLALPQSLIYFSLCGFACVGLSVHRRNSLYRVADSAVFYKLEVCGNPARSKSVGTTLPTASG